MNQMFLEPTIRELEYQAEEKPQKLELTNYEDIEQPFPALESERVQWSYYKMVTKGKKRSKSVVRMTRHRVIRLMTAGVFEPELARELNITKEDIVFEYSKMYHIRTFIEGFETQWKEGIVARGKLEHIAEEKAREEYYKNYNKGMNGKLSTRALLAQNRFYWSNPAPRYVVQDRLSKYSGEIIEKHHEKHALADEYNNKDISLAAYKKKDKKLTLDIRVLLTKKKQTYKDIFKNAASNKRMIYARAVPPENQQHIVPPIIVITSWRHGKDLIGDYRDWYNEKYAVEIAANKAKRKKQRDDSYYKSKEEVIEGRTKKEAQKKQFAELIAEGCSQAEAGRQVGITSSTANRWANNPNICLIIPNE